MVFNGEVRIGDVSCLANLRRQALVVIVVVASELKEAFGNKSILHLTIDGDNLFKGVL